MALSGNSAYELLLLHELAMEGLMLLALAREGRHRLRVLFAQRVQAGRLVCVCMANVTIDCGERLLLLLLCGLRHLVDVVGSRNLRIKLM